MGVAAPESRFIGIDQSAGCIASARATAGTLGLTNVEFHERSITSRPGDLGEFDYVVAHGIYSWVTAPVRDALLAACRRYLAPNGVACISYTVYPESFVTGALRAMMLFHVRGLTDDDGRIRSSQALLRALAEPDVRRAPSPWSSAIAAEAARTSTSQPGVLRHDGLGEVNQPVWWSEFAAHAQRHGLTYLSEADWFEACDSGLPPGARSFLAEVSSDRIVRE